MSVRSLRNSVHNVFATIHLFPDCFARNFEDSLVQRFWDTLAVRIVRWATMISPTRVLSNDLSTRKPKCSPGTLVLYMSNRPRGALFPSTNRNQVESCLRQDLQTQGKSIASSRQILSSVRKIVFLGALWW